MASSSCTVHAPQLFAHLTSSLERANASGSWKANIPPPPLKAKNATNANGGGVDCVVSDAALIGTITAIAAAAAGVAVELRHSIVEKEAHENEFGDAVLSVDLIADAVIAKHLKSSPHVAAFASEEHPVLCETDAYRHYKKNYGGSAHLLKKQTLSAAAAAAAAAGNKKVVPVPLEPVVNTREIGRRFQRRSANASDAVVGGDTDEDNTAANASTTVTSASSAKVKPPPCPSTCVTFDPLDGSSIIDTNFSVGSIFAIWRGDTPVGQKAGDMLASVIVVYGPRCVMYVAEPRIGVFAYMLYDDRHWHLLQSKPFTIAPKAKIFSPGNLRAITEHRRYRKFIQTLVMKRGLTLRYTGGMVPDTMQMLIKGNGLFTTPIAPSYKVKLRVCFECAPIAFMVHCAGGWSVCDATTAEPKFSSLSTNKKGGEVLAASSTSQSLSPAAAAFSEKRPSEAAAGLAGGGGGGGASSFSPSSNGFTMSGGSYMDVVVTGIDQRSAVGLGSASDIVAYWWAIRNEGGAAVAAAKTTSAKL